MRATKIKKIKDIFFKTIIVNWGCPFKSIREYILFLLKEMQLRSIWRAKQKSC